MRPQPNRTVPVPPDGFHDPVLACARSLLGDRALPLRGLTSAVPGSPRTVVREVWEAPTVPGREGTGTVGFLIQLSSSSSRSAHAFSTRARFSRYSEILGLAFSINRTRASVMLSG